MDTAATNQDLAARLEAMSGQIAWLVDQQKKRDELFTELTPILREVMATATSKLDAVEKRGWFAFGREAAAVAERVLDHYSADDVRALGDAIVAILDTVRSLTQPDVLAIVGEASLALEHPDQAEPVGLMGMMRASRQGDVRKGMAVFLELLRHVGRASEKLAEKGGAKPDSKARLAAALGPRRSKSAPALGPATPPPSPVAPPVAKTERSAAPSCAVPSEKAPKVATVKDGVAYTADGHLADAAQWTRNLALAIAESQGVALDEPRWKLIECARAEFDKTKTAANIRRLTQISGLSTRDIYALFPKAPARTVARIAGTPKPAGCI